MKKIIHIVMFLLVNFVGFGQSLQQQLKTHLATLEKSSADLSALYQITECYVYLGGQEENLSARQSIFEKAVGYAEKCKQKYPTTWQANYASALAYGALQQVSNDKTFKKACAKNTKTWIDNALAVNPKHAASWSVLGLWHYRMANLSTIESLFIGDLSKIASNQEAKRCLQKAMVLEPHDLKFYPMIAKVCVALNQRDEARNYLKKVINLAANQPEKQYILKVSNQMLNEL